MFTMKLEASLLKTSKLSIPISLAGTNLLTKGTFQPKKIITFQQIVLQILFIKYIFFLINESCFSSKFLYTVSVFVSTSVGVWLCRKMLIMLKCRLANFLYLFDHLAAPVDFHLKKYNFRLLNHILLFQLKFYIHVEGVKGISPFYPSSTFKSSQKNMKHGLSRQQKLQIRSKTISQQNHSA